jgi:DNA-binding transcriptional ArsR family regulator
MDASDTSQMPSAEEMEPVFRMHAELCKALANQHRLAMLYALTTQKEMSVGDLATTVGIPIHNVSQHLRVLKERKLVRSRKQAQTVFYSITNIKFIQGCTLIRQALIEQHRSEGDFLAAAEILDRIESSPLPE